MWIKKRNRLIEKNEKLMKAKGEGNVILMKHRASYKGKTNID